MTLVDINEGCHDYEMPIVGCGRILSRTDLDEHYVTYVECGVRTLIARLTICGKEVWRFSQWIRPETY